MLMVSGITMVKGIPLLAATYAKAMPVLPLVASTISLPSVNSPRSMASLTIETPILSLTEDAGFRLSIFASTVAQQPFTNRLSFTKGVPPTAAALSLNQCFISLSICVNKKRFPGRRLRVDTLGGLAVLTILIATNHRHLGREVDVLRGAFCLDLA